MTKKWIAFCLAALMLFGMGSAFAASPSITTDDTIVGDVEAAEAALADIVAFVASGNGSALEYFGAEAASEAAALAGGKTSALALVEAAVVEPGNYSAEQLKEGVTFGFPTGFSANDTIIVMVSIGGKTFAVKASAAYGDMVTVKFSAKQIEMIMNASTPITLVFFKA